MNSKRIAVSGAVAALMIASIAQAQTPGAKLEKVNGAGQAKAATGETGTFHALVMKLTKPNGDVETRGDFAFRRLERDPRTAFGIHIPKVRSLTLSEDGKGARFQGPGTLTRRTRVRTEIVRGGVFVGVRNNRAPRSNDGTPDLLTIRFVPAGAENATYEFEGNVERGDIDIKVLTR